MAVFYATLVSTYISYFLARIAYEKKYRLIAIMFSIIVALILIFVSGLRSGIGDTGMYMHSYKILVQNPVMPQDGKDIGFTIISLLLIPISSDPQILVFVVALITNLFNVISFNKYKSYLELQVYMYITSGYYIVTMNGMRQCLAAALLFMCVPLIIRGKFKVYCILVVIISMFHGSALMLIPIYFIVREESWSKKMIIFMILGMGCVLLYDVVSPIFFKTLESTQYAEYSDYDGGGSSFMRVVVNAVPVILSYLKREDLKEAWPESNVFINMSIINTMFVAAGMFNWIFNRFTLYLQLYNFVLIPFIIKNCFKGKEKRLVYFAFIICYFIFFYYEQVIGMGMGYPTNFNLKDLIFN